MKAKSTKKFKQPSHTEIKLEVIENVIVSRFRDLHDRMSINNQNLSTALTALRDKIDTAHNELVKSATASVTGNRKYLPLLPSQQDILIDVQLNKLSSDMKKLTDELGLLTRVLLRKGVVSTSDLT